MNSIFSDNYYVHFNQECYTQLNTYLSENKPSTVFILVDENTIEHCYPLFISKLESIENVEIVEINSGEVHKNLDTCIGLWNVLTELGADRNSLLINVGGGVITDMGGFVASTFKRGIRFINVPTTLLSMVDASVGGKTGIDLGVLKNQIGVFSNPEMVLVDTDFLNTLSRRELTSGMAEILKYGLTYDAKLWIEIVICNYLNIRNKPELIYRSIEIKNDVVKKDPKEKGLRKILNFGHTLGHAIESHHLESIHLETLTHGEAIAIGMITEIYLSHKLLNFPDDLMIDVKNKILNLFEKISIDKSEYPAILDLLKHDKKNTSGQINFVLLSNLEKHQLNCIVPENLLIESLDFYQN